MGGTIGTDWDILVSRSTDAGTTWTDPAPLNTNAGEDAGDDYDPQVTTDRAGNWVAVWNSFYTKDIYTEDNILVSRSTDAGASWSSPAPLNNAGQDSGYVGNPQVTTDGAGNWVAVWQSQDSLGGTIGTDYDILVSRSTDAGANWSIPAALNTNAGEDSGYDRDPQVTTDGAGIWVAVWYSSDSLGGTIGTDDDVLLSRSADGGATWSAPAPLNSNASSDSGLDAFPQVTTDGAGNWVAVWQSQDSLGGTVGYDPDILFATFSSFLGDFGDAPAPYPTSLAEDGARHAPTGPRLGALRDLEDDGQPSHYALGDDDNDQSDDEDGVTLPVLSVSNVVATTANVEIDLQSADATANYLDAWIDFNGDGDWADANEQIFSSYDLGTVNGVQQLSFTVPQDTGENISYGTACARFRLSTTGGLQPTGLADDGEVEDHLVALTWFGPAATLSTNASEDSGNDWFPQLTTDGSGNWVAVWDSQDSLGGTIGTDADILVSRSTDAGATWTDPAPLNTNASEDSGHDWVPQLTTDGAGNWVAVWQSDDGLGGTIGTDYDILVSRSTDAGANWSIPAALNTNAGEDSGYDRDPQVTTDGAGNWVAVWDSQDSLGGTIGTDADILVSRSTDAGASWTDPAPLNTNASEDSGDDWLPQLTTDRSGNWVAVWQSQDSLGGTIGTDGDIFFSRSTDAGATWSAPAPLNSNAGEDSGDDSLPQVTTDGAGNWVAVWHSDDSLGGTIGTDFDILVSRSTDAGVTWTDPAPLNTNASEDSGDDWRPQLTTDWSGNWVAVWESPDSLGGTIGTDFDILVSRSTDAGASWTDPAPLNTNASSSDSGGDASPQVTTDGAGNWGAVWRSQDSLGGTVGDDPDILFATFSSFLGDFGDAPAPYPTSLAEDGARHAPTGPRLGALRDLEDDGQPSHYALGDDDNGQSDDEDGVTLPVLSVSNVVATTANVEIDLQSADATANYLDAWIDFNGDGDWADANEQIFSSYDLGTVNGVQQLSFTVPQDTGENISYGTACARFRLSTTGGLQPTGLADDGEVEDHLVALTWFGPAATLSTNASEDSGDDLSPQLTTDGSGNWVAVWESPDSLGGTIGTDSDILVSRSTDAGVTWTDPAPLNTNATEDAGDDRYPQLTTDGAGNWVAVWHSDDSLGGTIGTDGDILVSRSTDAGATWTDPAPLNTNATEDSGGDWLPQLTTDAAGNWVAVWESYDSLGGTIGTDADILVSRSTDAGASWTDPAPLNTNATEDSGHDSFPQVTTDGAGNWVAVWQSRDSLGGTIGTDWDILVSRSTDAGASWTDPAPLNTNASEDSGNDWFPQLTTDGSGNWVAVWDSPDSLGGTIGTDWDILVSRSTDAGASWTDPAPLNTNASEDSGDDWSPQLTTDGSGNWVAVWNPTGSLGGTIGTDSDILVSRSTDAGATWTDPAPLNSNASSDSGGDWSPQLTTDGAGNWVAVWESQDSLGGTVGDDVDILFATFSDADPGVNLTPASPINLSEAGGGTTLTVELNRRPTAEVTATFAHDGNVQITPSSLTFLPSSYAAQAVTVTAVDDQLKEGLHVASIQPQLTTTDPAYQALAVDQVMVMIADNDPGDMFNRPDTSDLGADWPAASGFFVADSAAWVTDDAGAQLALFDASDAQDTDGIIVEALVNLGNNVGHGGLIVRATADGMNMYLGALCYDGSAVTAQIWKCVSGTWTPLAIEDMPSAFASQTGRLELQVIDYSLTLRLDGDEAARAFDVDLTTSGLAGMRGTQGVYFDDFALEPINLAKVTLPHSESFDRPDGALPAEWTSRLDRFVVNNNQAEAQSIANGRGLVTLNTQNKHADVFVEADVALRSDLPASYAGLVARYNGTLEQSMYLGALVKLNGAIHAQLWICQYGSWRQLASETLGSLADDPNLGQGRLRLQVHGHVLQLSLNDVVAVTTTNDELSLSGYVGLRANAGESIDNFSALASAGPPMAGPLLVLSGNVIAETASGYRATVGRGLAIDPSTSAADVVVEADVAIPEHLPFTHAGLVARCNSLGSDMYLGALVKMNAEFQAHFWLKKDRMWKGLLIVRLGSVADMPELANGRLRLHVHGSVLQLSRNGIVLATTTDDELTAPGYVGIRGDAGEPFDQLSMVPSTSPPMAGPLTVVSGDFLPESPTRYVAVLARSVAVDTTFSAADVTVRANVQLSEGVTAAGLVARYSGPGDDNFYWGTLYRNDVGTQMLMIFRQREGIVELLGTKPVASDRGLLRFSVIGNSLTLSLDLVSLEITDTNNPITAAGSAGIRGFPNSIFENVTLQQQ